MTTCCPNPTLTRTNLQVLQLLANNLGSTPQTLGDAKKEPPEELADRHERVLAATCTALAALIELAAGARAAALTDGSGKGDDSGRAAAAAEQAAEVVVSVARLLEQPSFYKQVLQSKAVPVRRSAYRAVAAVASALPPLLSDDAARAAAPAVLGAVGEREPGCHPEMWEAVLAFARAHPSAWAGINLQKAFLPRLWVLLRHGCYGSGAASYPALLPLVAALPQAALGPLPGFFVSLLCALWEGLGEAGGVVAQRAAAAAYQECLLYALLRSEQLAAVNSEGGDLEQAAAATATTAGAVYCSQLLDAALPPTVLATATSAEEAGSSAAQAAAQVLTGVVSRLTKPAGADKAATGPEPRLDALLEVLGRYCVQAVQAELSIADQHQPDAAAGAAPEAQQHPSASLEQVSSLVAAVTEAGGERARGAVGMAIVQPLAAALLPEVRTGEAPPAAASLLAALLKAFPQHAAAAPLAPVLTRAVSGGEGEQQPGSPSLSAGAPASAEQQFAALRLHQSASFTIDSVARRAVCVCVCVWGGGWGGGVSAVLDVTVPSQRMFEQESPTDGATAVHDPALAGSWWRGGSSRRGRHWLPPATCCLHACRRSATLPASLGRWCNSSWSKARPPRLPRCCSTLPMRACRVA